jgi:hypothetical protein
VRIDAIVDDALIVSEKFGAFVDPRCCTGLLGVDSRHLVVFELKRTMDGDHPELRALRYAPMISGLVASAGGLVAAAGTILAITVNVDGRHSRFGWAGGTASGVADGRCDGGSYRNHVLPRATRRRRAAAPFPFLHGAVVVQR